MLVAHRSRLSRRVLIRDEAAEYGGVFVASSRLFAQGRLVVEKTAEAATAKADLLWVHAQDRTLILSYREEATAGEGAGTFAAWLANSFTKRATPNLPPVLGTKTAIAGMLAALLIGAMMTGLVRPSTATQAAAATPPAAFTVPAPAPVTPPAAAAPKALPAQPSKAAGVTPVTGSVELPE